MAWRLTRQFLQRRAHGQRLWSCSHRLFCVSLKPLDAKHKKLQILRLLTRGCASSSVYPSSAHDVVLRVRVLRNQNKF